jgi:hypothetical protein
MLPHVLIVVHRFFAQTLAYPPELLPMRAAPLLVGLNLLSCVYLFFALGRLFQEHWLMRFLKALALFALVLTTEGALGLAAAS